MSSLSPKDRVSLCLFSYEDGRRCRTPRIASHPHFCFYHAQKESQSQSAEKLAKELDYFFSGDYLSACDLSTAMGRLIPAVIRGHIKPRLARTVAYMLQTQLQAIHLAQHEYINAFGTDGWRDAVRHSVNANNEHLSPPDLEPSDTAPKPDTAEPDLAEPEPIPTPPTRVQPSTQAAHATSVGAGLARPAAPHATSVSTELARPNAASQPTPNARPTPTQAEAALAIARNLFPERPNSAPTQSDTPATVAAPPFNTTTPTQTAQPAHLTPTPPEPPTQRRQPGVPTRDPYAIHFDHNYRLIVNDKPW
jgi:hypothetical protein